MEGPTHLSPSFGGNHRFVARFPLKPGAGGIYELARARARGIQAGPSLSQSRVACRPTPRFFPTDIACGDGMTSTRRLLSPGIFSRWSPVIERQEDTGISPSLLLATGMQSDKRQARQGDIATSVKRYFFYARNMRQTLSAYLDSTNG